MALENMCMGCMKEKGSATLCPLCGYDESAPISPLALPTRTVLNHQFVVGRVLGKPGGFGVTYLGWDMTLETRVAVKEFLPRELAARSNDRVSVIPYSKEEGESFKFGLAQFLQEARTLARFDHANVVRVRAFFEENDTAYLVMDYYEGTSLNRYLEQKGGRIPEKLALDIMMPILDGLREVHEKGFLHRDIKPHNIYLTRKARPILLDFGAARFAMGERSRSLSVLLTPGYAPYEQYHRKGQQGSWTDIYACGATLYRMVTGNTPPEATEREKEDALLPPDRMVNVSRGFQTAVLQALATEPDDRPQTMHEFQEMLLGKAGPSPVSVPDPEPKPLPESAPPSPPPTKESDSVSEKVKPPASETWKKWGLLAVLLLVGVFVVYSMGSKRSSRSSGEATSAAIPSQPQPRPPQPEFPARFTNSLGQEFVYIKPGTFWMGSPSDEPERDNDETRHKVTLTKGFYLQTTEVTQGQWERVMGNDPSYFKDCGADCPVENVSWEDIQEFIRKLNREEGKKYRLPTEAEWEYACRAGTETPFSFGKCLSTDQANYDGNYPMPGCGKGAYREKPAPVKSFAPNAWGLYDMHGNVYEWCEDWLGVYPSGAVTDPEGPSNASVRVLRGGGWGNCAEEV